MMVCNTGLTNWSGLLSATMKSETLFTDCLKSGIREAMVLRGPAMIKCLVCKVFTYDGLIMKGGL